jgi:hypothetical protein
MLYLLCPVDTVDNNFSHTFNANINVAAISGSHNVKHKTGFFRYAARS